ncbi:unnamed protein product [Urochloa decumbens]|uniref:MADS-box domain-containing protein n=1 Tax=Urochloa decumbens TaxID=240449 RepID=A0ABC9BV19_9POAL
MARGDAFDRRKKSLQKMAWELSELCGVDVALVVAGGGGVPAAWESREGVMARYRALAPELRARHTHRAYLEAKLGKEEATLARVRQAGPVGLRVNAALSMLLDGAAATAEDARQLLDVIDAAIRAADARRAALGMPADGAGNGVVLEGVAPLDSVPGVIDGGDYDYLPHHDGAGEHAIWGGNDGFQPFTCGATAEIMRPGGYGFQFQEQCDTSGGAGGAGMDGYYYNLQMAPPAMYGDSSSSSHVVADANPYHQVLRHAPHPNSNLSPMWSAAAAADMVPAEYTCAGTGTGLSYYNDMVGTPAATSASRQGNGGGMSFATGTTSGNFVYDSPPALSLATGNDIGGGGGGGNFISAPPTIPLANGAGGNFTYATPAQPLAVSYSGELTDAGWYAAEWQPQRDGGGGHEPIEQLHYLSDLEDTQLHLWGN